MTFLNLVFWRTWTVEMPQLLTRYNQRDQKARIKDIITKSAPSNRENLNKKEQLCMQGCQALESFTTCSRVGTRATHFQKLLDSHIYPCIYSIFTPIHTCEHAIWEWHQQRMCSSIVCQNMCVVPELHTALNLSRHRRVSVFFRYFLAQMQSESHLTSSLSRTAT